MFETAENLIVDGVFLLVDPALEPIVQASSSELIGADVIRPASTGSGSAPPVPELLLDTSASIPAWD